MTVPENPNTRTEAVGNGITVSFPFDFLCLESRDLRVSVSGVELSPSQYTVGGLGQMQGGTVTFYSPPAAGSPILMELDVVVARAIDYQDYGDLFAATVNFDFDRLWLAIKGVFTSLRRALLLGPYDVDGQGSYRANNNRIQDLGDPVADQDAVNRRSMFSFVTDYVDRAIAGVTGGFGWFLQAGTGAIYRTFQDKMRDAVSVRDFGEVGDGVADDTAVFALALATSAKRVYVPEGVYVLEGLTIPAGKTLFGPGTLKWKGAAAAPMLTLAGADTGVEGLTLDGNGPAQALNLVMVVTAAAPRAFIKDCLVTNGRYKFLLTDVAASPDVSVTGCRFRDWGTVTNCDVLGFRSPRPVASTNRFEGIGDGHCIRLGLYELDDTSVPVSGGVVAGNTFRNTQHVGVTCELFTQDLSISGNTFDNLEQGVKIERLGGTCFDISVTGNTFKNLTLPTANNLQGLRVTFTGNTCIDCAGSGADMGTEGVCSGNTFLRCGDAPSNTSVIRATGSQSDVVISNNLIIDSRWRGIEVNGSDCVCSDNRVKNAADRCISVTGTNAIVSNNRTTGGTFGLLLNSSATGAVLSANNCSGASSANYSIDNAARFSSFIADSNIGYSGDTFTQTIAAGVITAPRAQNAVIVVDTEGAAAADDLDSINTTGGGYVGQTIVLRSANIARAVTVKDGAQLRLAGDFILNNPNDALTLVWIGSQWYETSRSDNA